MALKFEKIKISEASFESAAFMDVTGDGSLDIVSGEWWYEGPDFKKKHRIGNIRTEGEYYLRRGTWLKSQILLSATRTTLRISWSAGRR